jgi:hypothetical protein
MRAMNDYCLTVYSALLGLYPSDFQEEYRMLLIDCVEQELEAAPTFLMKMQVLTHEATNLFSSSSAERYRQHRKQVSLADKQYSMTLTVILAVSVPVVFYQLLDSPLCAGIERYGFWAARADNLLYQLLGWCSATFAAILLGKALTHHYLVLPAYLMSITAMSMAMIGGYSVSSFYQTGLSWIAQSLPVYLAHFELTSLIVFLVSAILGFATIARAIVSIMDKVMKYKITGDYKNEYH